MGMPAGAVGMGDHGLPSPALLQTMRKGRGSESIPPPFFLCLPSGPAWGRPAPPSCHPERKRRISVPIAGGG